MRVFDDAGVAKLWEYLEGVKDAVTQQEKKEAEAAATSESRPAAEEKPAGKSAEKSGEKSAGKTKKGVSQHSIREAIAACTIRTRTVYVRTLFLFLIATA